LPVAAGASAKHAVNAAGGELPRVRADSGGQALTTNQGMPVADNQSSLKAGLRGPAHPPRGSVCSHPLPPGAPK